jgi:hypothetical protein
LCVFVLLRMTRVLQATSYFGEWNALRLCFGLNGALIHGDEVPVLAAYYEQHYRRRPPDHMLVEWFAGETPQRCARAQCVFARPCVCAPVCLCMSVCVFVCVLVSVRAYVYVYVYLYVHVWCPRLQSRLCA